MGDDFPDIYNINVNRAKLIKAASPQIHQGIQDSVKGRKIDQFLLKSV
jgi:hypothetical protein